MNKCVFCNKAGQLYPVNTTCPEHISLMIRVLKLACGPELYDLLYGEE